MRTALLGAALLFASGCSISDSVDLELAREEARFVPTELVATLGFAVSQAQSYGEDALIAQNDFARGMPSDEARCDSVAITDAVGDDGQGTVLFDFAECPGRNGRVHVAQDIADPLLDGGDLPDGWDGEGWDGDPPDGWEGDFPDGSQASVEAAPADESVTVTFQGYSASLLEVRGAVGVEGDLDRGTLGARVGLAALDYDALASVHGTWARRLDAPGKWVSLGGTFSSMTGVEWDVRADALGLPDGDECLDAQGGTVTAVFENSAGRTEVVAVFDESCDGCADITVDGYDRGRTCFSADDLVGG